MRERTRHDSAAGSERDAGLQPAARWSAASTNGLPGTASATGSHGLHATGSHGLHAATAAQTQQPDRPDHPRRDRPDRGNRSRVRGPEPRLVDGRCRRSPGWRLHRRARVRRHDYRGPAPAL